MRGAREYAEIFEQGQHGRLYLKPGEHARGKIFNIYLLPKDVIIDERVGFFCQLSGEDYVEVYGMIPDSGQPGWSESYGWLHKGKWQEDFEKLVTERKKQLKEKYEYDKYEYDKNENAKKNRINNFLKDY